MLAVGGGGGGGGGGLDIFSLDYHISFLSPSLRKMDGYRQNCLKEPLNPNNQVTKFKVVENFHWTYSCQPYHEKRVFMKNSQILSMAPSKDIP